MAPSSDPSRREVGAAIGLVLLALAPFAVAIATMFGDDSVALGDYALTDLRVRDVWSRDVPLVGAYSRFGWNHPGPAMFLLFAPISALFGRAAWATDVAGAFFQALTIVGIAVVAWRAGRLPVLVASLALTGLAYGAIGPSMVLDAWNPNFAYPLFILFVLLAWRVACRDRALVVPLVVVASLLVQAHIGYAPLVVAAGGGAVAVALRHVRDVAPWRRPALLAIAATAVLWAPPVVHELVHPSNVRPLAASLTDADQPALGFETAAHVVAEEFRIPPPWLGGDHDVEPFGGLVAGESRLWLLVPIVLLVAAWLSTRRRTVPGSRPLLGIATALFAVGVVAIARVLGQAERYVFYWRVPAAILVVAASLWSIGVAFRIDDSVAARRALAMMLATIVVGASVSSAVRVAQYDASDAGEATAAAAVDAVRDDVAAGSVLVRAPGVPFIGLHRSVLNELLRAGAPVRVDADLGFQFGYSRAVSEREVDEIWYVVESGEFLSILSGEPGARVLWSTSPLRHDEETELRAAQRDLWRRLLAAGRADLRSSLASPLAAFALGDVPGIDPVVADRVADLNLEVQRAGTCRCAIVAFAVADDPSSGRSLAGARAWRNRQTRRV